MIRATTRRLEPGAHLRCRRRQGTRGRVEQPPSTDAPGGHIDPATVVWPVYDWQRTLHGAARQPVGLVVSLSALTEERESEAR